MVVALGLGTIIGKLMCMLIGHAVEATRVMGSVEFVHCKRCGACFYRIVSDSGKVIYKLRVY